MSECVRACGARVWGGSDAVCLCVCVLCVCVCG